MVFPGELAPVVAEFGQIAVFYRCIMINGGLYFWSVPEMFNV